MEASGRKRWLRAVVILGIGYLVAGIAFGTLAGRSASTQMRTAWRLAAWLTSAAGFAAHIWYEVFRYRDSPLTAALHAALAAALGAFGLALRRMYMLIGPPWAISVYWRSPSRCGRHDGGTGVCCGICDGCRFGANA